SGTDSGTSGTDSGTSGTDSGTSGTDSGTSGTGGASGIIVSTVVEVLETTTLFFRSLYAIERLGRLSKSPFINASFFLRLQP
ncbi:MAG: hypothetical protein WBK43_13560, partial [Prolixibacteraceae bacterium]